MTAVMEDLVLKLPCRASGNPQPTITWLKDDLNVPTGIENTNLFKKNRNVPNYCTTAFISACIQLN